MHKLGNYMTVDNDSMNDWLMIFKVNDARSEETIMAKDQISEVK